MPVLLQPAFVLPIPVFPVPAVFVLDHDAPEIPAHPCNGLELFGELALLFDGSDQIPAQFTCLLHDIRPGCHGTIIQDTGDPAHTLHSQTVQERLQIVRGFNLPGPARGGRHGAILAEQPLAVDGMPKPGR
jgi:hypothetical protein